MLCAEKVGVCMLTIKGPLATSQGSSGNEHRYPRRAALER